jgi:two-component system OmpR family response regulator
MLEAGADDCLLAPHNPREVLARVRALLRRRDRSRAPSARTHRVFDGHLLDAMKLIVRAPDGREVEITPLQQRLLSALLARPGEVVSREHLLAQVLGADTDSFDRAIDVHVSRLKKRLARVSEAELITAYRGVGYRLDVVHVTS